MGWGLELGVGSRGDLGTVYNILFISQGIIEAALTSEIKSFLKKEKQVVQKHERVTKKPRYWAEWNCTWSCSQEKGKVAQSEMEVSRCLDVVLRAFTDGWSLCGHSQPYATSGYQGTSDKCGTGGYFIMDQQLGGGGAQRKEVKKQGNHHIS